MRPPYHVAFAPWPSATRRAGQRQLVCQTASGGFGNGRESDIYNSIRESEIRGALEKYVGGDASICNSFCGRDLFGLVGIIRHDGVSPVGTTRKTPATLLGLRAPSAWATCLWPQMI
jgi:hypothetical protein